MRYSPGQTSTLPSRQNTAKYKKEMRDFYLSVFCRDGNVDVWPGEYLMEDKYAIEFTKWQARNQATKRLMQMDTDALVSEMESKELTFHQMFLGENGKLPRVIQLENENLLSPEFIVMLNKLTNFTERYTCPHPSWDDHRMRLKKYARFIHIDVAGFAAQLRGGIENFT